MLLDVMRANIHADYVHTSYADCMHLKADAKLDFKDQKCNLNA